MGNRDETTRKAISNNSGNLRFLPSNQLHRKLAFLKKSFSYRVWKRKVKKYGGFNSNDKFHWLDYGSGVGALLFNINGWFPNCDLTGLDIEEKLIEYTEQRLPIANMKLIIGDAWPLNDKEVDCVSCIQVIEHIRAPEKFFSEANRVLKDRDL